MNKKDKIALLIPTRNRPNNIKEILDEYKTFGSGTTDFIIGVDDDDEYILKYASIAKEYNVQMFVGPRKRLGPTLNDMAVKYAKDYFALGFIGDDMRPRTMNWDSAIMVELHILKTGFVHGDDGIWGEQLATQVFITSDVIEQLGYMVPPNIIHMYLDNFWSDMARAIDKFKYRGDILIEHLHPAWGKGELDELYSETNNDERMNADRILYENYKDKYQAEDIAKLLKHIKLANNDN